MLYPTIIKKQITKNKCRTIKQHSKHSISYATKYSIRDLSQLNKTNGWRYSCIQLKIQPLKASI